MRLFFNTNTYLVGPRNTTHDNSSSLLCNLKDKLPCAQEHNHFIFLLPFLITRCVVMYASLLVVASYMVAFCEMGGQFVYFFLRF